MQLHQTIPPAFERNTYAQRVKDNLALTDQLNGMKANETNCKIKLIDSPKINNVQHFLNRTIYFSISGESIEAFALDLKHDELVFSIDVEVKDKKGIIETFQFSDSTYDENIAEYMIFKMISETQENKIGSIAGNLIERNLPELSFLEKMFLDFGFTVSRGISTLRIELNFDSIPLSEKIQQRLNPPPD
jgi:hypothetical protein